MEGNGSDATAQQRRILGVGMGREEDGTPRAMYFCEGGIIVDLEAITSGDDWTFHPVIVRDQQGQEVAEPQGEVVTLDELLEMARSLVTGEITT